MLKQQQLISKLKDIENEFVHSKTLSYDISLVEHLASLHSSILS